MVFKVWRALIASEGRMGSPEIAALNVVHAGGNTGSYGMATALALRHQVHQRVPGRENKKKLGYDAYKKKLIAEGKYRQRTVSSGQHQKR